MLTNYSFDQVKVLESGAIGVHPLGTMKTWQTVQPIGTGTDLETVWRCTVNKVSAHPLLVVNPPLMVLLDHYLNPSLPVAAL